MFLYRYRPPIDVIFVPDIQALFRYPVTPPERTPPPPSPTFDPSLYSIVISVVSYPRIHGRVATCFGH